MLSLIKTKGVEWSCNAQCFNLSWPRRLDKAISALEDVGSGLGVFQGTCRVFLSTGDGPGTIVMITAALFLTKTIPSSSFWMASLSRYCDVAFVGLQLYTLTHASFSTPTHIQSRGRVEGSSRSRGWTGPIFASAFHCIHAFELLYIFFILILPLV